MRALVRPVSPSMADGLLTHIERQPVDVDLARRQWDGYVAALESVGWDVIEAPAAQTHPDAVFIEDTMVWWDGTAVICRPGARERRGETGGVEATVRAMDIPVVHIEGPDTLDGGDVLKIDGRFFVGVGGRSSVGACQQLSSLLGVQVTAVPITKVLHLKSGVTALPDGTVIGYPPLLDDTDVFERFLPVPEDSGSHVVVIDDRTVLMAASAPRSAQMFRDRGLSVVEVDISEFEKMEGCVTCLSVRLR